MTLFFPPASPLASLSSWGSWKSWILGNTNAPWCLIQIRVSFRDSWNPKQTSKSYVVDFNRFYFMFFMSRCVRKAHTDSWKWKNHQCRPYHQVRAASFSPLSQIECFTVRRNNYANLNTSFLIRFDHTPLATPNGDILIRDLSFEVCFTLCLQIGFTYSGK